MKNNTFTSGFVSIIGRPNVGKSTLLNSIIGEKIVITSDKPQTTRNRIQGIHNIPGGQIVFIDTPGIHTGRSRLNKSMDEVARSSISGVDLLMLVVEATGAADPAFIHDVLAKVKIPVVLVINKVDLLTDKALVLKKIADWAALFPFKEIVPISAGRNDGVEHLVSVVGGYLPEGPAMFPDDILTDMPEKFIVAEMIREKVFRLTRDEVPYSTAVVVESFIERENGVIAISAAIMIERDTQKGIIIGSKGEMLKKIGTQARQDIERLLDTKIYLELFVKVVENWSERPSKLKELGYE
ncbi:MAG: GTPase Era [Desulfuromonadaceae bacterium]|nr:GTPase Era [Desulfuromonadaceae bacterium]MDD5105431.1 GTPase Era [Desulfuromonadaceae bacterium]